MGGRSDLPNYSGSAERMENFLPLVQGPAMRRSGFRFVKEVKDSSKRTCLIPFVVSTIASYVIEAGNLYFRFYTEEGRLESGGTPVEVVTPYLEADVFDLHVAQSADTLYIVHPDYAPRKLVRTSATSFSLSVIEFLDGPYLDENTDETMTLQFAAATGATTCTAAGHAPFLAGRDEGRMIRSRSQATGGNVYWARITSVSSTTVVNVTIESDQDALTTAEKLWQLGAWYIGNYPRTVTFHEQRLCFGGAPDTIQRVDLSVVNDYERFSPTGSLDDATAVYSEPDIFADNAISYEIGSSQLNAILWLRVHHALVIGTSSSIFEMSASTQNEALTPDNANVQEVDMTGTTGTQPVRLANTIVFSGRDGRSVHSSGYSVDEASTVASFLTELADHVTGTGVVQLAVTPQPVPLIWVCTTDGQLASLTLQPRQKVFGWARHPVGGSMPGQDRANVLSVCGIPVDDHDQLWAVIERRINNATVRYVEFMEEPFRLLDPEQAQENAFFGDAGVSYDTPIAMTGATAANPVVVTAPSHGLSDGDEIRITKVGGMTELNGRSFVVSAAALHTFALVDSNGDPIDGSAFESYTAGGELREKASTFTGLSHLEGETVSVLADGAERPQEVVAAGSITLATSASEVHVGLAPQALWVSQRLDTDERDGPTGGKPRAIGNVSLRLLDTLGGELGAGEDGPWSTILYRTPLDAMDAAPPLFTGEKQITHPGGVTREPRVAFRQTGMLPMTVLSIVGKSEVGV